MSAIDATALEGLLGALLGDDVHIEVLKDKPGRRRTVRARSRGRALIAKAYTSQRAPTVAARVEALAAGPPEPVIPRVERVDPAARVVVFTHVPGRPLGDAIDRGDVATCRRAGTAVGCWHAAWHHAAPHPLRPHTVGKELAVLDQRAAHSTDPIAQEVRRRTPILATPWPCSTVVHRDLYEDQIVIGDEVGLIDLDDAACGPPDLDVGNLIAHLTLRSLRHHRPLHAEIDAFLDGYRHAGPELVPARLRQCTRLSLLRLACIHAEPALLGAHVDPASPAPSSPGPGRAPRSILVAGRPSLRPSGPGRPRRRPARPTSPPGW